MSTFLSLSCVGLVFGLLLRAQDLTRRWTDPVVFLVILASLAAVYAVNGFEQRDGLRRPGALLLYAWVAVTAPGLTLAISEWLVDPSALGFLLALVSAATSGFTLLGRIGWVYLPALYAGAVLCRAKHRVRPRTDLYLWTLMAVPLAWAWPRFSGAGFLAPERAGEQAVILYGATLATGVLLGWRFSRTGYAPSR